MIRSLPILVLLAACQEYDLAPQTFDETFEQQDVEAISDVLFVVDDSSSMVEEQERLTANFSAFLDLISSSFADYQLGVISTDTTAADAGVLRGGIFNPATPDLVGAMQAALSVGSEGSRNEQGLAAATFALDGRNAGFLRPEAELNIIIVSDEDDGSPDTVQAYMQQLATAAGDGAFGFHGIVGDLPLGCATGTSAAEAGPRYIEAIDLTGGHRESICADDYSQLLAEVGLEVASLPNTFHLADVPKAETLEVYVDEVRMHEREEDGWTYDPGENAIVFHGRAVPRPGMAIAVNYEQLLSVTDG